MATTGKKAPARRPGKSESDAPPKREHLDESDAAATDTTEAAAPAGGTAPGTNAASAATGEPQAVAHELTDGRRHDVGRTAAGASEAALRSMATALQEALDQERLAHKSTRVRLEHQVQLLESQLAEQQAESAQLAARVRELEEQLQQARSRR